MKLPSVIHWALGDPDAVPHPPREHGPAAWWVAGTATATVLFGLAFDPELDPLVRGSWHLVLYGVVPLGVLRLAGPTDRGTHGLGPGDWRWWLPRVGLGLGLLTVVDTAAMVLLPDLQAFYPPEHARTDVAALVRGLAGMAIDLFGWEMLFRGVLLGALARKVGIRSAIGLAALLFFVGHLDKPLSELLSSLPGGIVAGWFAWRARSFLPVFVLHAWQLATVYVVGFALAADQAVTSVG